MRYRDIVDVTPIEPEHDTPTNPNTVGGDLRGAGGVVGETPREVTSQRPILLSSPSWELRLDRDPDAIATGAVETSSMDIDGERLGSIRLGSGVTLGLSSTCGLVENEPFTLELVFACFKNSNFGDYADLFSSAVVPLKVQVRANERTYNVRIGVGMTHEPGGETQSTWSMLELPVVPWHGTWMRLTLVWDGNDIFALVDDKAQARRVYRAAQWPFFASAPAAAASAPARASAVAGRVIEAVREARGRQPTRGGARNEVPSATSTAAGQLSRSVVTLGSKNLRDVYLARIRTWTYVRGDLQPELTRAAETGLGSTMSRYEDLGASVLGERTSTPAQIDGFERLDTRDGAVWWVPGYGTHYITGARHTRHTELYKTLGPPIQDPIRKADCTISICGNGALVETSRGVFVLGTPLLRAWVNRGGAEGIVGAPLRDGGLSPLLVHSDADFTGGRLFASTNGPSVFIDRRSPLVTVNTESVGAPCGAVTTLPTEDTPMEMGDLLYVRGQKTAVLLCEKGMLCQNGADVWEVSGSLFTGYVALGGLVVLGPAVGNAGVLTYQGEVHELVQVFKRGILYERVIDGAREVVQLTQILITLPHMHQADQIDDGPFDSRAELYAKVTIQVDGRDIMREKQFGPMEGYPSSVDLPIRELIDITPETRIYVSVNAWDYDWDSSDDWIGQMELTLDASNHWGLSLGNTDGFERNLTKMYGAQNKGDAMSLESIKTRFTATPGLVVPVDTTNFRSRGHWHFFNHKSETLSRALYASAFTDVDYMGEFLASLLNPFDEIYYHVIKGIGSNGNCFGFSAEAVRAYHGLSHLAQPIYKYGWRTVFDHARTLQAWQGGDRFILTLLKQVPLVLLRDYCAQAENICRNIDREGPTTVSLFEVGGSGHVVVAYAHTRREDGTIVLYVADVNAPWGPPDPDYDPTTAPAGAAPLESRDRRFSMIEVSDDNHVALVTHQYSSQAADKEWTDTYKFDPMIRFHSRHRGAVVGMIPRIWMTYYPLHVVSGRPKTPYCILADLLGFLGKMALGAFGDLGSMWFCGDGGAPEQVNLGGQDLFQWNEDLTYDIHADAANKLTPIPFAGAASRTMARPARSTNSVNIPKVVFHNTAPFKLFVGREPLNGDVRLDIVGTATGPFQHALINGQTALSLESQMVAGRFDRVTMRDLCASGGRLRLETSQSHHTQLRWAIWGDPHLRPIRRFDLALHQVSEEPAEMDMEPSGRIRIRQPRVASPLSIELTQIHRGEEFVQRFDGIQTHPTSREVFLRLEAPGKSDGGLLVQSQRGPGAEVIRIPGKLSRR